MTVSLLRNPLSPSSHLPVEGLEEALIKEEVEKEDGLVSLDNLIEETDLLAIEEDLDLDDLLKKFDKSPNNKRPRVSGKTINKDKVRCYKCREFGHYRDECLVDDRKPKQDDTNSPKRFEDYTYTYSSPDVQPQMQMSSMHSSLSMGYDQALGVIKDSINTANSLASLNL